MDLITLQRIQLLHPALRKEALTAYTYVNNKLLGKGVRLRFAYTLRTIKEQDALYAQGRTKPGKKITNAKGWQSIHNYGLAFDIVLLLDKNGDGIFEEASWNTLADYDNDGVADWKEVTAYFKSLGWSWGGDWTSFPDSPHFEKTFGHTWRTLQEKHLAGATTTEVINGLPYTWVKL